MRRKTLSALADETGSALPLSIGLLALGVACLLLASQINSIALEKERNQLLADSLAWKYSRERILGAPGQSLERQLKSGQFANLRIRLNLLADGKTVLAQVCSNDQVCASSSARSSAQAQPP
jgi:hypothetical protein